MIAVVLIYPRHDQLPFAGPGEMPAHAVPWVPVLIVIALLAAALLYQLLKQRRRRRYGRTR